jgi:hypothetical protein
MVTFLAGQVACFCIAMTIALRPQEIASDALNPHKAIVLPKAHRV